LQFFSETCHSTTGITDIVKFWLLDSSFKLLPSLNYTPDRPHRMGSRAPKSHLIIQLFNLTLLLSDREWIAVRRRRDVCKV
jgi:hypothetical protein